MKILVFGAGANGKACQAYIEKFTQDELIGFLDNDPHKTSGKRYGGGYSFTTRKKRSVCPTIRF